MWSLSAEDRLAEWKEFRTYLGCLSFPDAVEKTVNYWSFAPFVGHYLDTLPVSQWPSPWELLVDGIYDDRARALGMIYTLVLSKHGAHSFEILHVTEPSGEYNVVSIDDGAYLLNYIFNEVGNKEQQATFQITQRFSADELQLSKY